MSGSFHSPSCHVGASYDVIHFFIFLKSLLSLLNIASVLFFCFFIFLVTRHVGSWASRSAGKESACNEGDLGLVPGSGRSPGEGKGYPPQYPCLENPMDRGAWRAAVRGATQMWQHRVGRDWATNTFTFMLCGILTPCPGAEPAPLALEGKGLSPGPPGKAPLLYFDGPLSAASPLEHRLHEAESFSGHARGMQGLSSRTGD